MEISLRGKVAVITGGSSGIGEAIAETFALSGANVVLVSRKAEKARLAAEKINRLVGHKKAVWIAANVSDPEGLQSVVDSCKSNFGFVNILVNGAAANPYFGQTVNIERSVMRKILEVNLEAVEMWISEFWSNFWSQSHETASCINIASIGGLTVESGIGFYNVSKAGIIHLTKQLANELAPRVRVNSISPGLVRTEFARALWENWEDQLAKILPLGRIGEPRDITGAALFLASELSSWVTGTNIVVDGGALVRSVSLG
ncbi:MAG: SDR family oxidoreductase [Acidimicrobiaceae bacterium]|nr:SDR family oxidoreductase [Acidimicrobiaceae bacterium]